MIPAAPASDEPARDDTLVAPLRIDPLAHATVEGTTVRPGEVEFRLRIDTDAVRREVAEHFRRIADQLDPPRAW